MRLAGFVILIVACVRGSITLALLGLALYVGNQAWEV